VVVIKMIEVAITL